MRKESHMMTAKKKVALCGMLTLFVFAAAPPGGGGCDKKSEPAKSNVPKPPTPDVTPKASMGSSGAGMSSSASSPAKAPIIAAASASTQPAVKAPTTNSAGASVGQPIASA